MFAVFKTGGKQYKVKSGDILSVEKLVADLGDKIRFNEILALGGSKPLIGTPLVNGACIEAEILNQSKGKKVIHFVKRRRKHSSQRKKGHRQDLTIVKVLEIKSDQKIDDKCNFEILGKVPKLINPTKKQPKNEKNTTVKSLQNSISPKIVNDKTEVKSTKSKPKLQTSVKPNKSKKSASGEKSSIISKK
tara:strand:+ start:55 stop:624 length:570 start_codon:yes stop_codon:yes gene_type:complete